MESNLNDDVVERAAAAELARLKDLEDSTWFDNGRRALPMWMNAIILIGGVALLTLFGVWLATDGSGWPLLGGAVGALAFVVAVTSLERRHHGVALPHRVPPRILKETALRMRWAYVAIMVMVFAFTRAVQMGAPWWVFSVIAAAGMGSAVGVTVLTQTGRFARTGSL